MNILLKSQSFNRFYYARGFAMNFIFEWQPTWLRAHIKSIYSRIAFNVRRYFLIEIMSIAAHHFKNTLLVDGKRKIPSKKWVLNPWPLYQKTCALPLCLSHYPSSFQSSPLVQLENENSWNNFEWISKNTNISFLWRLHQKS